MRWPYWILVLLYCVGIFFISSMPKLPEPDFEFEGSDKVAHAIVYGGLAALVSFGLIRSGRPLSEKRLFFFPFLFAALYGFSDELHQYFVPNRHLDPLDLLANASGALVCQCGLIGLRRLYKRAKAPSGASSV